jgi:DNA-binding response OmpR family regulator
VTTEPSAIRVLAVEDEPDIRMLLEMILERGGFETLVVADGMTGLERIADWSPDVVLLDVGLPVIDGWEVLRRIREQGDLPVVLLTAYGSDADRIRGREAGATDFLTKPFDRDELVAVLRTAAGQPG